MAEELCSTLERLTAELRQINKRLQSESPGQPGSLADFREALDTVRLTTWTAHELLKAREGTTGANAVLILTANERARRFGQMAVNLCSDLDSGFLRVDAAREAVFPGIETLRERLRRVS